MNARVGKEFEEGEKTEICVIGHSTAIGAGEVVIQ